MATDPNKGAALPPPPRLTGNQQADLKSLLDWTWATYNALAESGIFLLSSAQPARFPIVPGSFTISESETGQNVTFTTKQPDTNYFPQLSVSGSSGTVAADAYRITGITKTTEGFTVAIAAPPGAGASITFSYLITR